ncbi:hypothetical protein THAOC_15291 [Thalassiosira oceanica]|uniref:Uncharacterized protein n=1 Tax=Thalassiosira oceanica TaxID=159749 RepID=K0T0J6_THAOC|nr:hypothetical protein THAOC_15291 [Thalassiosira oceanica]|eukprot:EJK64017.1 hypothetical protein THAOC_15291 [Thalassiosira oceanica]
MVYLFRASMIDSELDIALSVLRFLHQETTRYPLLGLVPVVTPHNKEAGNMFEDKSSVQSRKFHPRSPERELEREGGGASWSVKKKMKKIIRSPVGPALLALVISAASGFTAPSNRFRCRQQIQRAGSSPHLQHEGRNIAAARQATPDDGSEGEAMELASNSSAENQVNDASSITEAAPPKVEEDDGSKSQGFSIILLPTLLFKFTIVLLIKVATDAVAYPALWLYRLARLTKRKIHKGIRVLFGSHDT